MARTRGTASREKWEFENSAVYSNDVDIERVFIIRVQIITYMVIITFNVFGDFWNYVVLLMLWRFCG